MGILIALLVLSLLIFVHELGHFLAARLFGVKVERFSIGFGPVVVRKECCGTEWVLSAFPLGGYVKMKGQDDLNPLERSNDPDSYNSKHPWQRIIILLAGPLANLILAFFLYIGVALMGVEDLAPKVGEVLPNSPAALAGIEPGDRILSINDQKIEKWSDLSLIIARSQNRPLQILIDRKGKLLQIIVTPKMMESENIFKERVKRPMIGISPAREIIEVHYSLAQAIPFAFERVVDSSLFIVKGLKNLISGALSPREVGGVITIMDVTAKASEQGITTLFIFTALVSVNLGILNLLPIPALDGGHIIFNLYEWIMRRPPNEEVLYRLTLMGWIFLISLMGLGLYNDINRLLGVQGG
ncbi:MAG: RIP metalloprotease RseP [Epsilonproteobacteria bacterium]|nr:RIP metalloprotease RseP [Campylobacterota bacterium]NPA57133.1 RIP metalloprotease RseP [Campylobacterota bacterium]